MNINFADLTWVNRHRWPREIKYATCLVVFVLSFLFLYYFFISPTYEQYEGMLIEEERLIKEFEKKHSQAVHLPAYEKQLKDMNVRFGQLIKQLPTENEMPGLLEDISRTGISSGLSFELFAPAKEINHPYYSELPVNITVVGTYHQMATFLSRVAKISRVVTLHEFTMTPAKNDKPEGGADLSTQERLVMSMTIKIYRYRTL